MTRRAGRRKAALAAIAAACLLAQPGAGTASGIPVVDVAALTQLIQQVTYWQQQINQMTAQLEQLRAAHAAITGSRGMEAIAPLGAGVRAALPPEISQALAAATGAGAAYAGLAARARDALAAVSVLSAGAVGALGDTQRRQLEAARSATAAFDALARTAYDSAAARQASLQQLLSTIAAAGDQKAILDLQARLQAEQALLANEQARLSTLAQLAAAQADSRSQQRREAAVRGIGRYRDLPPRAY